MKGRNEDMLVFLPVLLPDLFPCIAVSLSVKLKINNYKGLYCFHVKDVKKRLFMNANTKTPVLPSPTSLASLPKEHREAKVAAFWGGKEFRVSPCTEVPPGTSFASRTTE